MLSMPHLRVIAAGRASAHAAEHGSDVPRWGCHRRIAQQHGRLQQGMRDTVRPLTLQRSQGVWRRTLGMSPGYRSAEFAQLLAWSPETQRAAECDVCNFPCRSHRPASLTLHDRAGLGGSMLKAEHGTCILAEGILDITGRSGRPSEWKLRTDPGSPPIAQSQWGPASGGGGGALHILREEGLP